MNELQTFQAVIEEVKIEAEARAEEEKRLAAEAEILKRRRRAVADELVAQVNAAQASLVARNSGGTSAIITVTRMGVFDRSRSVEVLDDNTYGVWGREHFINDDGNAEIRDIPRVQMDRGKMLRQLVDLTN